MEYWNRMGGPHGITWIAWLVLAPISILFTIEVVPEGYSPGYSQAVGYLIGLLGHVVTGLTLLLGKVTLFRKVSEKPRPALMLTWFAVAGIARGASVAWMFGVWGITENPDYFERMRSGAVLVLVWFAVSAVMVDGYQNYKASFAELSEKVQGQQSLRNAGYALLRQRMSELLEQIRQTLTQALQAGSSSSDMHRAVEELVRPLAHGMDKKAELTRVSTTPIKQRLKLAPIFRTALHDTPYNPGWTTLMAVFGTLSSRIWQSGILAILDSLAMGLVIWAMFRLAKRLNLVGLWVPVVWFVTGLLTAFAGQLVTNGSLQYSAAVLYFSVNVFAPALIVSLIGAFDRNAQANLGKLREVIAELEWEIKALEQRTWVEQRRLARFVHSELQSRIRAFALRMDLAARMPSDEEIQELKDECESALALGNEQREFALFMDDITELWDGLIALHFEVSPEATKALRHDPYATAAAIEICREGISNAAKHAKAKHISVALQLQDQQLASLHLRIANDGGVLPPVANGFGLSMIAELASNWSLNSEESLTVLSATIPIHLQGKN